MDLDTNMHEWWVNFEYLAIYKRIFNSCSSCPKIRTFCNVLKKITSFSVIIWQKIKQTSNFNWTNLNKIWKYEFSHEMFGGVLNCYVFVWKIQKLQQSVVNCVYFTQFFERVIFVVSCPQPEIPSGTGFYATSIFVLQWEPRLYRVGGGINFYCAGNKQLTGPNVIGCQYNGTWNGEPGSCLSAVCFFKVGSNYRPHFTARIIEMHIIKIHRNWFWIN